jgi:C1A family cysteine protease
MASKFGYKQDPIECVNPLTGVKTNLLARDYDFTTGLQPTLKATTDGDIDLSKYATVSNQLALSSCAGNATADAVEVTSAINEEDRAKAEGRDVRPLAQLSRLFVYTMARGLEDDDGDGLGDIHKDEGTYIRNCFEILSRFGICDESIWPYITSRVYTSPSIKALRQAVGHRIHSYYRIKETGQARVDAVITALRARHPVVFGTLIDEAFMDSVGPDTVTVPKGEFVGGHAMMIIGYRKGLFKIKNSWGGKWRGDGYCYFTPEYIAWSNTWDLWVPTLGTTFTNK